MYGVTQLLVPIKFINYTILVNQSILIQLLNYIQHKFDLFTQLNFTILSG